jgi:hypothetical protein
LDDSRLLHEIPIPRSWLSVVPLSFDFNGDGKSEFLTGTWYGSGYGCSSDNTFADIYIIDGNGDILFKKTFNDGIYLPALLMRKNKPF